MNRISDWTERFRRLQSHLADPLDLVQEMGNTADEVRALSRQGFTVLKGLDTSYQLETISTEWWISQALKKFRGQSEIDPSVRETQAIAGFLERNLRCRSIRLPWHIARRMRELLNRALPCVDIPDGHFGPGAVSEHLDPFQKWNALSSFRRNPRTGSWSRDRDASWHQAPERIARLCAVPKDVLRDRLITVEPVENSFWQQALRDALLQSVHSGPLRGTVMDQIIGGVPEDRQRRRCLRGSLYRHTTTLDLEDASDSIPYDQVVSVFPAWVLYEVDLCRSSYVSHPEGTSQLYMYGGMGNASTFIVETLYFWALFTAVCERLRVFQPVTVFGDDVVVPSRAAQHPLFKDFCLECGVKLNETKSVLNTDSVFREACGLACFAGQPLHTLISIKGPFDNTDIGRVNLAGLISRLSFSPLRAHQYLARQIYDECDLPCIRWDRPVDGLDCVFSTWLPTRGDIKMTWDQSYQRWYIKHSAIVPRTRRYYCKNLSIDHALGVLRGQLSVRTIKRKGSWRSVVEIDLPHRVRLRPRKIYLPW